MPGETATVSPGAVRRRGPRKGAADSRHRVDSVRPQRGPGTRARGGIRPPRFEADRTREFPPCARELAAQRRSVPGADSSPAAGDGALGRSRGRRRFRPRVSGRCSPWADFGSGWHTTASRFAGPWRSGRSRVALVDLGLASLDGYAIAASLRDRVGRGDAGPDRGNGPRGGRGPAKSARPRFRRVSATPVAPGQVERVIHDREPAPDGLEAAPRPEQRPLSAFAEASADLPSTTGSRGGICRRQSSSSFEEGGSSAPAARWKSQSAGILPLIHPIRRRPWSTSRGSRPRATKPAPLDSAYPSRDPVSGTRNVGQPWIPIVSPSEYATIPSAMTVTDPPKLTSRSHLTGGRNPNFPVSRFLQSNGSIRRGQLVEWSGPDEDPIGRMPDPAR